MTKNKKIGITKRDEDLFKYLFANKGATMKQIHRDVFHDSNERKVYRRVNKLKDFGLLDSKIYFDKTQYGVLNVTKKGLKQVYDLDQDLAHIEVSSGNLKHDTVLLDLKNILTKMQCFDFFATENEIESKLVESETYPVSACRELHSDGLLGIRWKDSTINFAIEYENSEKTIKRYHDYLKNYYAYPVIQNVIYFTKDEKIRRRIINTDKKIIENLDNKVSKIFVTNIEELKKPFTRLKTFNTTNDFLEFNWSNEICL